MAKAIINIGSAPADGSGDPIRTSFDKVNKNFTELYDQVGVLTATLLPSPVLSVAGKIGTVLLNADDILGGTSKFYVDQRINEIVGLPPPVPSAGTPYTNTQIDQKIGAAIGTVYTKAEIDQLLLNINEDWGLLNSDWGLVNSTADLIEDYGSIA